MPRRFYITGRSAVDVAASIERGVADGRLAPGEQLPPVRVLAGELGLSPTTVAAAYRTLRQRGVTVASGRAGTAVAPRPPLRRPTAATLPPGVRDLASGNPDPALLPDVGAALRRIDTTPALYGEPCVDAALATAARARLEATGVDASHLTVTAGALDAIDRVLDAHCRSGDRVAVEDPGYPGVFDLCAARGLVAVPVAVDAAGCVPDALAAALPRVRACILAPRAQNPTGAALDARRAQRLRAVLAARPDVLVVEDDHAAGVAGADLHTLTAGRRRFAHLHSVSKAMGPDLRLAVLAGDAETVAHVEGRRALGPGWVPHLIQRTVVALWADPAVRRSIEAACAEYTRRRTALRDALAARGVDAAASSGINMWIRVDDEDAVAAALLDAGWAVLRGRRFRLDSAPGIRVTAGSLPAADAGAFAGAVATATARSAPRIG